MIVTISQLTPGARHYSITTAAAANHLQTMLEARDEKTNEPLWEDLTGFDRACIAEVLEHARQHGLKP